MSRAYLCVSIAVRGDEDAEGSARQPPSFEGTTDGVVARIHPFFERFGARPTYLLSADVLRVPACLDAFVPLAPSSELGTHLDHVSAPEGERAALTDVTDLFIRAFGHQPQSFRGGARGPTPDTLGILESLGYAVDASVTPHVAAGAGAPTQPYRPDAGEPARAGSAAILEVPVTIRRHPLQALPGIGRRVGPRWLSPAHETPGALVRLAEDELAAARRAAPERPAVLHAVLDNVDVVPRASKRRANEEQARGVLDGLRALLAFARGAGIPVVGLTDVLEILR
jgi:hypothetical protein